MGLTLGRLIALYLQDPRSSLNRSSYSVRQTQERTLLRLSKMLGGTRISRISRSNLIEWHSEWSAQRKIAMVHALMTQLRQAANYGSDLLQDRECARLRQTLSLCRFEVPKVRKEALSQEHAEAFSAMAHKMAHPSLALAQAFQFEARLTQKEVIGEIVPSNEPGDGLPHRDGLKWVRGLVWSEVDSELVLRHAVGRDRRVREIDLKNLPLIMRELSILAQMDPGRKQGPIIVCETSGRAWRTSEYRRKWRRIADAAGIPSTIQNRDSI